MVFVVGSGPLIPKNIETVKIITDDGSLQMSEGDAQRLFNELRIILRKG